MNVVAGEVLGTQLAYNAQRDFGTDVTTRMMYAEKPGGLLELSEAIRRTLNDLIMSFYAEARVDVCRVAAVVIAGNTIMEHLSLSLDPSSIRHEPYVPATTTLPVLTALELELNLSADTPIYLLPAASGYVGGDVTRGLLATQLAESELPSILIEIGTNGELSQPNKDDAENRRGDKP